MYRTRKTAKRRDAFTLIEMLVVIAIILAISALAAAFAPRVNDNQNLSRAVDNLEQWLLTAKMRAKRDGLATGVRFIQAQGDLPGTYSQLQYIQQPDPLSGGWLSATPSPTGGSVPAPSPPYPPGLYLNGGSIISAGGGMVSFYNVDFSLGGALLAQPLVENGDYLEVRDGGVYSILGAAGNALTLSGTPYDASLTITNPTTNYRILRQPRILIGEEPLTLPNNFAVVTPYLGAIVLSGPSNLGPEILFSPKGGVVGTNAGSGMLVLSVYDQTMTPFDINRVGLVAVKSRTGFIGAYGVYPGADPFYFAEIARESGL